ncbi:MAG: TonB family protein [Pseudomonadota bacterium]
MGRRAPQLLGAAATAALHAAAVAALLGYEPARSALFGAAPIMVELIALQRPEPKLEPPSELPKPKPVAKIKAQPRPAEPPPVITSSSDAPSPILAPAAPPAPPPPAEPVLAAPAPAAAPAPVTAPIFDADYLENPPPPYPPLARRLGEQGRVILRVLVNAEGRAEEVQIRTSSGYLRLDEAARDAVRHWKFVPAKRGSEAVRAWVLIPISFKLEG